MSLKQEIEHKVDILETNYKDACPYFPGTCSCFFFPQQWLQLILFKPLCSLKKTRTIASGVPFKLSPCPPPLLRNYNSSSDTLERNSFYCSKGRLMHKHWRNLILDPSDNMLDPCVHLFQPIYSPPDTAGSIVIHCGVTQLCSCLGGRKRQSRV